MPIPESFGFWKWFRAILTWATVEEAVGDKKLAWWKRVFRKLLG